VSRSRRRDEADDAVGARSRRRAEEPVSKPATSQSRSWFRPPPDWDRIIGDLEAERLARLGERFVTLELALAYHHRACRHFSVRAVEAALRDVDHAVALDPWFLRYHTTRAIVLGALGRVAEAFDAVDAFLTLRRALEHRPADPRGGDEREEAVRAAARRVSPGPRDPLDDLRRSNRGGVPPGRVEERRDDEGRAHATRSVLALQLGQLDLAESDARRAFDLDGSASNAHRLGAVLYARGDIEGAAEVEARSVFLVPGKARYRFALAMSLRKLGRLEDAHLHVAAILASPDADAYRERLDRLFP
jgi:tetratricopeptide (TPR) repeat protein